MNGTKGRQDRDRHDHHDRINVSDVKDLSGNIIGLGIDLVARDRVARMLANHRERFLRKYFTPEEAKFCITRPDPIPDLAVRLAAKEAAFKAIGARRGMGIGWTAFEVVLDHQEVPSLKFHGKAKDRAELIGAKKVWLSLTHEDLWVAAVVIVTTGEV